MFCNRRVYIGNAHPSARSEMTAEQWEKILTCKTSIHPPFPTRSSLPVSSAVKYLHDKGITHRDIKLENILRSSSGPHKLCDFGSCVQVRGFSAVARELSVTGEHSVHSGQENLVHAG